MLCIRGWNCIWMESYWTCSSYWRDRSSTIKCYIFSRFIVCTKVIHVLVLTCVHQLSSNSNIIISFCRIQNIKDCYFYLGICSYALRYWNLNSCGNWRSCIFISSEQFTFYDIIRKNIVMIRFMATHLIRRICINCFS